MTSDCFEGRCFYGYCSGDKSITWWEILLICIGAILLIILFVFILGRCFGSRKDRVIKNAYKFASNTDMEHLIINPDEIRDGTYLQKLE